MKEPVRPSEGICPLPFTQLFLDPSGRVTPCCYLAQEPFYEVGTIQKQTFEEMWNSEKLRALRREFLEGKPETCKYHMLVSKCHLLRKDLLDRAELKEVQPFPMIRLDMLLNGKCNLECVMCGVWKAANDVYTSHGFWEQGREDIFPYLYEIDAKGGEPFIQKDIYRLIDEVSAVNPQCNWHFTTNGHYRFNEKIQAAVSKIKIRRLTVSIDSLDPENFARIRKKGDLSLALRTLDDWIAYQKKPGSRLFRICSNFVVQRDNWHEVPQFYEFCRGKGISPFFIILTNPADFSILGLPSEERLAILDHYVAAMKKDRDPVYYRLIRPILGSLADRDCEAVSHAHEEAFEEMKHFAPSIAEVHV